jgi:hypothetical protein
VASHHLDSQGVRDTGAFADSDFWHCESPRPFAWPSCNGRIHHETSFEAFLSWRVGSRTQSQSSDGSMGS